MFGSIFSITIWSSLCAYGSSKLEYLSEELGPDSDAAKWLEYFDSASKPLGLIGSLFSFSLVFRFKVCYDRWWMGRQLWGKIISQCLDIAMQVNGWIVVPDIAQRFTRYIIMYSYACKCQLRHISLCDDGVGNDLVDHGLLTKSELLDLQSHPSWQPNYFLGLMRQMVVQAYLEKGSYRVEISNVHSQMYRCFDNTIKDMNGLIGDCVALQAADLPLAYDQIHVFVFFLYFIVASVIWSVSCSWLVVPMSMFASWIILSFIILGTNMVDPFGTDLVDLPLDLFCKTIEEQVFAMEERASRLSYDDIARRRTPNCIKLSGVVKNRQSTFRSNLSSIIRKCPPPKKM